MHKFLQIVFVSVFAFFVSASAVNASNFQEVLGDSVSVKPSDINFPPVTAGPGFILPDSKFYLLDRLVQEVRIAIAITPEQKANLYMRIAGERMSELRVMMQRDDEKGIQTALFGIEDASTKASKALADASSKGRDNSRLAKTINDTLYEYRKILADVSYQASPVLQGRVDSTSIVLLDAKSKAENFLNEKDLLAAIESDFDLEIENDVLGIQTKAERLEKKLDRWEYRSSQSAEKKLAIEQWQASKSALKEEWMENKKAYLEQYQERKKKLQEDRKQKLKELRESARKARQKAIELRKNKIEDGNLNLNKFIPLTVTPTP